jgi:hypothetical protein
MKSRFLVAALILLLLSQATRAQTAPATPAASPLVAPTATPVPAKLAENKAAVPTPTPTPAKGAIVLPPEKASPIRLTRFASAPVIDGNLDEEVWKLSPVFRDFYQIRPGDNIAPSQPTEAMIGYDAKFLYLGFRVIDAPGKVRATVAKRDSVFDDDWVGVILDTFNDKRRAYQFFFNPLGVQADAVRTEDGNEDFSVDVVMESKGVVGENGYTVEVAIPFKSLRYEAGKGKLWGLHIIRVAQSYNAEQSSWMPISRDNSSALGQAGHITGIEDVSTERTLELIPSLTLSETGRRVRTLNGRQIQITPNAVDPGRFVNGPVDLDPGLTAKFGLSPTVTLDLALNPDFAQVEADATVVTANQRFPIFFEEKRPFFLENIDIFRTQIAAVNTRTIVDPDVAVKLSGKRGRNSFGLMFASDNAPGNYSEDERTDPDVLPDIERFLDKNSYVGVLRLKRDVGVENNIGLIATTYNFIENHNHTGGFDGRFRFSKKTTFQAQVLGSTARRFFYDSEEDRDIYRTGNGLAYAYTLDHSGRNFGYEYSAVGRSRFFRADVGFNRRFNSNNQVLFVRYKSDDKPKAKIVSWRAFNIFEGNFDWQGRSQSFFNLTRLNLSLQRQTFVGFGLREGYERAVEEEFGAKLTATRTGAFFGEDSERSAYQKGFNAFIETTPSKKFSMFAFAQYTAGQLDYDFGAGPRFPRVSPAALADPDAPLDPGPGNSFYVESNFTYKPTDTLRTSLDYTKSRLVRRDTGRLAFDDNIFSLRSTYQFTRFAFARARLDYSTLSSQVRGQFLFGWTPNPGTSLYVGYNDDINRNGYSPFTSHLEPGFRRNGRTFFIKMSYLFRRSFG